MSGGQSVKEETLKKEFEKQDRRRRVVVTALYIPLSVGLALVSEWVADFFHVRTPGDFVGKWLYPPRIDVKTWGPGMGIIVEWVINSACWLVVLWVAQWFWYRREQHRQRD